MGKSITSDAQIRALKPSQKTYTRTIQSPKLAKGTLLLIINSGGKKSFKTRYRFNGQQKGFSVGSYPSTSLAKAVEKHNEAMEVLDDGQDPKVYFEHKLAEIKNRINLQELFDKWHETKKQDKSITLETTNKHLWRWNKYLKKDLAILQVEILKRQNLTNVVEKIRKRSVEESRKSFSTLNMMLSYAVSMGYIKDNPLIGIKAKDLGLKASTPRNRWLSLDELITFWKYLDSDTNKISTQSKIAIKIAILTGARRSEITKMTWSELNLNKAIWTIPETRAKNKSKHDIYLSSLVIDLLEEIKNVSGEYLHVFVSPQKALQGIDEPLGKDTLSSIIYKHRKDLNFPDFSFHDLRRSAATNWAEELKINSDVIELMLNHKPQNKLIATYQVGKRSKEQKSAWNKWGELLNKKLNYS